MQIGRTRRCGLSVYGGVRLLDNQLHATVLGTTFAGGVAGDGLGLAIALGGQPIGGNAFADEIVVHRLGTALGQALVVLLGTGAVGVAAHVHADVLAAVQHRHGLVKDGDGIR